MTSHTIYVVCGHFTHELRDLLFKVESERQIFDNPYHDHFIYYQSFCQNKVAGEIIFHISVLMECLT